MLNGLGNRCLQVGRNVEAPFSSPPNASSRFAFGQFLTYAGIATSTAVSDNCVRFVGCERGKLPTGPGFQPPRDTNRSLAYRMPSEGLEIHTLSSALVRELQRVVQFHSVGVSIRDEDSNTFHRHFVDAETEAAIPPGPELHPEPRLLIASPREATHDGDRC
jgi:hypothetical protein